jgi:hypothetical protein
MKTKPLFILIVCAVILALVAVRMSRNETRRSTPPQLGNKVLPSLERSVNDVGGVLVCSPSVTTRVARIDGIWRVPGKHNYPADFSKVRELLTKLVDLKILQSIRSSPAVLSDLQLGMTASGPASAAILLDLQDRTGRTLATLRVGKPRLRSAPEGEMSPYGSFPDGRFVATDNDHVYLVGDALTELATSDKDWLDAEFLNVNSSDVTSIEVTGTTSGVARVERTSPSGELALKDLKAGQQADAAKLNSLAASLSFLRFDDIADPALTPEQTGLDKPVVFKGKTRKGEVYTVRIGKSPEGDSRRYVSASVAFETPPAPPAGTNAAQVAALKIEAAEQAKTAAAVQQLEARISPWVYLINSYQAEAIARGHADLVAVKQEEKKEPTPEAP